MDTSGILFGFKEKLIKSKHSKKIDLSNLFICLSKMNVNLGLKRMDRKELTDRICPTDVSKFLKIIRR